MELKELKERLETIKNMDNIDDLKEQIALKDELARQIEYTDSLERDLVQEMDETRDIEKRSELERRLQENRNQKDERKVQLEQIENSVEEIQKNRKGQQQEAREHFTIELQEQKEKNQAKIDKKKGQLEEIKAIREQMLDTIEENKAILKIKKPDSKVYQAVEEESAKCIEEARNRNKRIKRLTREITALEKENKDIDTVLSEIELIDREEERQADNQEIKEQEDKMWEDYRKEQEEAETKKGEEIDLAYAKKEEQEAIEKEEEEKRTQEEIAQYQENEEQNSRPNLGTVGTRVKKTEYVVKNIQFTIEGNQPVYHVFVEDKAENKIEDISMSGFDKIGIINREKAEELYKTKNICQAAKYYDVNIEKLLMEVDAKYDTLALRQYEQMIKDVELKPEQKRTELLDINYDFSELYNKPKEPENREKLKALKKLAKTSANREMATYQKEPNFFKVIWKKISQKLLEIQEKNPRNQEVTIEENVLETMETEEVTSERMRQDLEQLHDEPGFSMDEFVKDMPEEEANKYRSYRESLRINAQPKTKIQRRIGRNVTRIMQQDKEMQDNANEEHESETR